MGKKVKTYDPKKVVTNFFGIPIQGYAQDEFINVTTDSEGTKAVIGCDREAVRTIDPAAALRTVAITLLQSSDTNDLLSQVVNRDNQKGDGIGALLITDLSGRTLLAAKEAWIVKKPDFVRSNTAGTCQWVFQCLAEDEQYHIGGHS